MNRIFSSTCLSLALAAIARAAIAAPLLAVDVDDRTTIAGPPPNTVPGFLSYSMAAVPATSQASTSAVVGGYTVTLNAVAADGTPGGVVDDRDRPTPVGGFPFAQIYDDFIFGNVSAGVGGGIDMIIDSGGALAANSLYRFSLYAYDTSSNAAPQPRTADWHDGNNSDNLFLSTSFSGLVVNDPTTNGQYRFTGVVRTDAMGNLLLKGRSTNGPGSTGSFQPGVFINGFEINEIPEPSAIALVAIACFGLIGYGIRKT